MTNKIKNNKNWKIHNTKQYKTMKYKIKSKITKIKSKIKLKHKT